MVTVDSQSWTDALLMRDSESESEPLLLLLVRLIGLDRLDVVEPLGLKELEPLSDDVCAGLIGFGASGLDARVGAAVTGESH